MPEHLSLSKIPRFVRGFSGQVAMSIAVSAAVAGVLAVPELLFGHPGSAPSAAAKSEIAVAVMPVFPPIADGKIADRHRDVADDEDGLQSRHAGLIMPASLAMPMAVNWPQPARLVPEPLAQVASAPPLPASTLDVLPPRRPVTIAEQLRPAGQSAPLQIMPPAVAAARIAEAEEAPRASGNLLRRVVVAPVARVSETVSGAAGLIGAAGSWTVAQASGLLPRW